MLEKTSYLCRISFVLPMLLPIAGCPAPSRSASRNIPSAPPPPRSVDTKVLSFAVSAENLNVDKVGLHDGNQRPDGNRDLAFETTISGPIDALFVVSSNAKGEPGYGLRADTLISNEEIPAELGSVIDTGKMTVGIGVTEQGHSTFLNEESGSLHLGDGVHRLSLYVANTASLRPGSFVRIYVKAAGVLIGGPVAPY